MAMGNQESYGQLGHNDTVVYFAHHQLKYLVLLGLLDYGFDYDWRKCSIARKTDGTLWAWGSENLEWKIRT